MIDLEEYINRHLEEARTRYQEARAEIGTLLELREFLREAEANEKSNMDTVDKRNEASPLEKCQMDIREHDTNRFIAEQRFTNPCRDQNPQRLGEVVYKSPFLNMAIPGPYNTNKLP